MPNTRKFVLGLAFVWIIMNVAVFCTRDARAAWNEEQLRVLELARVVGEEIGMPETIQAIALQETMLGTFGNKVGDRNLPVGKRSYGVAQVKVATARYVMHRYPELKDEYFGDRPLRSVTDEEFIVLLMTDDEACIVLAAQYFVHNLKLAKAKPGSAWSRAVMAYNQGWGRAKNAENPRNFEYVQAIWKRITDNVRPYRAGQARLEEERRLEVQRRLQEENPLTVDVALPVSLWINR